MTILLRSSRVMSANGTTTITIDQPTTPPVLGDTVLLHLRTTNNVAPTLLPDGFELISGAEIATTHSIRIYKKVAGSSEPASYTVTLPLGETGILGMAILYSTLGHDLVVDDISLRTVDTLSQFFTINPVTPTVVNAYLTSFFSMQGSLDVIASGGMVKAYPAGSSTSSILFGTEQLGAIATHSDHQFYSPTFSSISRSIAIVWKEVESIEEDIFAPSGLNANATGTNTIELTWTDNSDNENWFNVDRSLDGSTGWSNIAAVSGTTYEDGTVDPDTEYFYRVSAYSFSLGSSDYSNVDSATTLPELSAPSGLVAIAMGAFSIKLTWEHNYDYESGYEVHRSLSGVGGWTLIATLGINALEYLDNGLTPGTQYYYRVRAFQA